MTASSVPAPERPLNLIDAILDAARLYRAYAWAVIGFSLILQSTKVAAMFLSHAALGKAGYELGGFIATALLIINGGVCARLAFDAHAGRPVVGPIDLLQRSRPYLRGLLGLAGLYIAAAIAFGLAFAIVLTIAGVRPSYDLVILPGFVLVALWAIAAVALVADELKPREALSMSWQLVRRALGWALLFVVFQWFVLRLIPALADSIIGRHAPLAQWWVVEGIVSAVITPLLALTTATFFLALYGRYGEEALLAVRSKFAPTAVVIPGPGQTTISIPVPEVAWVPGYDPAVARIRQLPAVVDSADARRSRRASVVFGVVPAFVVVVVGVLVEIVVNPAAHVDRFGSFYFVPVLLGQAWWVHRYVAPYLNELQARIDRGVQVQAVVASVVSYRPRFALIGLKLQLLRYYGPDGTIIESYSQTRNGKLKAGSVVVARYDAASPEWVAIEMEQLRKGMQKLGSFPRWLVGITGLLVVIGILGLL